MSKQSDEAARFQNPFKPHSRRGNEDTLKYCAWEVLKDVPRGLHISQIAKEVQERGLRDLSRMRNASGQISSELKRTKDVFCQTREKSVWKIRALTAAARKQATAKPTAQETPIVKGEDLVGHRVAVWWKGEQAYFEGVIRHFDATTESYDIVYDDGDKDKDLKFHKYDVQFKDSKIDLVTVAEHNRDDSEDSSSEDEGSKDVSEWAASTEQVTASLDSTVCGEYSDGVQSRCKRRKGGRQAASDKKRGLGNTAESSKKVVSSLMAGANQISRSGLEMVTDDKQPERKRRPNPREENKQPKKTRVENVVSSRIGQMNIHMSGLKSGTLVKELSLGWGNRPLPPGLDHSSAQRWQSVQGQPTGTFLRTSACARMLLPNVKDEQISGRQMVGRTTGAHSPFRLAAGAIKPAQQRSMSISSLQMPTPRVEKINVLDLTRQMQPPQGKRPDLKNLTDVGDLMSLSELSDELKRLSHGQSEGEEVSSECTVRVDNGVRMREQQTNGINKEANGTPRMTTAATSGAMPHDRPVIKDERATIHHIVPVWKTQRHPAAPAQHQNPAMQFVSADQNPVQPQPCISRNSRFSMAGDLLSPSILSKQLTATSVERSLASKSFSAGAYTNDAAVCLTPGLVSNVKPQTSPKLSTDEVSDVGCKAVADGSLTPDPVQTSRKISDNSFPLSMEATSQPVLFDTSSFEAQAATGKSSDPSVKSRWKDGVSIAGV